MTTSLRCHEAPGWELALRMLSLTVFVSLGHGSGLQYYGNAWIYTNEIMTILGWDHIG